MELTAALVGTTDGINVTKQRQHRGHDEHQSREPVQHQNDTEWWLPVTKGIEAITTVVGENKKDDRSNEHQHCGGNGERPPQGDGRVSHKSLQYAADQRNQYGSSQPVVHVLAPSCSCFCTVLSCSGTRPLTWSSLLSARLRNDRTTTKAVMAKPITMAVSTSAWGRGSE